jgi:hypothetical protein
MASILLENSHGQHKFADYDIRTLLLQLAQCEARRHMRSKHAHEELLTLLVTIVVLLAVILFILIWKLC